MKSSLIILFLITSWNTAFAFEQIYVDGISNKHIYSFYHQDNRWNIDLFSEDEEGYPDLIKRQVYPDKDSALVVFNKIKKIKKLRPRSYMDTGTLRLSSKRLWTAKEKWSWAWEKKYAAWVRKNALPKFFKKYNIPADCADAAYAFRWIFARINSLPAANRLVNGKLMTHETVRSKWLRYPTHVDWEQDKRFHAAVNDLLNTTYTHSLYRDSYPVEINPQTFIEGIHHLQIRRVSGHTMIVNQVNVSDSLKLPLRLIWATVPRDLANLSMGGFWYSVQPTAKDGGFMRMLWPEKRGGSWKLKSAKTMPTYSLEQYDPKFSGKTGFGIAVVKRIAPNFDPIVVYQNGYKQLMDSFTDRIDVVNKGYQECKTINCKPGTEGYENWSTPSRDKRIKDLLLQLEDFISETMSITQKHYKHWKKNLATEKINIDGVYYPLALLRVVWLGGIYSTDPVNEKGYRWGLEPTFYAKNLKKKLFPLAKERRNKVLKNKCIKQTCKIDGKEWKKWDTYALDSQIQKFDINRKFYCKYVTQKQCNSMNAELSNYVSADLKPHNNLSHWLGRSQFFRSRPNLLEDKRWGSRFFKETKVVHGVEFFKENKDGFILLQDRHGLRLYGSKNVVIKNFGPKYSAVYLFSKNERAIIKNSGDEVFLYDRGRMHRLSIKSNKLTKVLEITDDQVYFSGKVFSITSGGVQIESLLGGISAQTLGLSPNVSKAIVEKLLNGIFAIHDFKTGKLVTHKIDLQSFALSGNAYVLDQSNTHYLVRLDAFVPTSKQFVRQNILIDKKTNKAKRILSTVLDLQGSLADKVWIIRDENTDESRVVEFDDQFNIIKTYLKARVERVFKHDLAYVTEFAVKNFRGLHMYRWKNAGGLSRETLWSDTDTHVGQATEKYLILFSRKGQHVLMDRQTDREILRSSYISVRNSDQKKESFTGFSNSGAMQGLVFYWPNAGTNEQINGQLVAMENSVSLFEPSMGHEDTSGGSGIFFGSSTVHASAHSFNIVNIGAGSYFYF